MRLKPSRRWTRPPTTRVGAGVDYPTTRERLAEVARSHHADREIVELIDKLPDKDYDSPAAVSKAISRQQ